LEAIFIAAMAANRVIGRNIRILWHLQGRCNIVVSRNPEYQAPGCEVVHSLEQADTLLFTVLKEPRDGDVFFPESFTLVHREEVTGPVPYAIHTYLRQADRAQRGDPAYSNNP